MAISGLLTAPAFAGFAEDCERLAADPEEPNRNGVGVALADIESQAAVLACFQAANGPLKGKPGSRFVAGPEPETTYRLIRAYLAEGPAQDIGEATLAARKIKWEAENMRDKNRLPPDVVAWYVEKGRQYFMPETYLADAKAGKAAAQMALAYLYLDPTMKLDDPATGELWLAKALAQAHPEALFMEGQRKLKLADTPEKSQEAVKLILQAAMRENADAQWEMAGLYLAGEHVPQNRGTATGWAHMAGERGNEDANKWLRDQEVDTGTAVVATILVAMIAAAIIDGIADEGDVPDHISDAELRRQQKEANSMMGNCPVGYSFNPYFGYCESPTGARW
ncbi:tetratricopeptide repeat protein [Phaeovulum sp.]|uniref:tetratricopeptide repeat protein n=1 Tax=Phaeovulum sp. TaxID=2934796 RepID=UPI00356ADBF0